MGHALVSMGRACVAASITLDYLDCVVSVKMIYTNTYNINLKKSPCELRSPDARDEWLELQMCTTAAWATDQTH